MSIAGQRMKKHIPPPDAITRNTLVPKHWARCEVVKTITEERKNIYAGEEVIAYASDLKNKKNMKVFREISTSDGKSFWSMVYNAISRDHFKVLEVFDPLKVKHKAVENYAKVLRIAKRLEKQKFLEGHVREDFERSADRRVLIYKAVLKNPFDPYFEHTLMHVKGSPLGQKLVPQALDKKRLRVVTKEELLTCENELVRLLAHSSKASKVAAKLQQLFVEVKEKITSYERKVSEIRSYKYDIVSYLQDELDGVLSKEEYEDCRETLSRLGTTKENIWDIVKELNEDANEFREAMKKLLLERGWRRNDLR